MTTVNIGIDNRQIIADALSRYLANTYTLYLKTQNFHWNITGDNFYALHLLLEKQYEDLGDAVDELAERIRALGFFAPGSFSEFSQQAEIAEAKGSNTAKSMLEQLLSDNQTLSRMGRELMELVSKEGDEISHDLILGRVTAHDKNAWMLRSSLE